MLEKSSINYSKELSCYNYAQTCVLDLVILQKILKKQYYRGFFG